MDVLNKSFSTQLEVVLLSEEYVYNYMSNVQQLATIERSKFLTISRKVHENVLLEIRQALIEAIERDLELDVTVPQMNLNGDQLYNDLFHLTISYAEKKPDNYVMREFKIATKTTN